LASRQKRVGAELPGGDGSFVTAKYSLVSDLEGAANNVPEVGISVHTAKANQAHLIAARQEEPTVAIAAFIRVFLFLDRE
jgi:hypothetical protein